MNYLNKIILSMAKILPKSVVKLFAKKYVAGETIDDALSVARQLNKLGFSVTLDILGEHVLNKEQSKYYTEQYVELYEKISSNNIDANISVKPTHIGLDISVDHFEKNLNKLLKFARKSNNFLRIDMESSKETDQTIKSTMKYQKIYKNIGTVMQAYLYRTIDDIDILNENKNLNIRLCKGIYKENKDIAIQSRDKINSNYIKIFKKVIGLEGFVALATHDVSLIRQLHEIIEDENIDKNTFEFQTLYGVPMKQILTSNKKLGFKTRIYVPFGPDWYDYSMRRLNENPNIAGYIFKNIFNN